MKRLTPLKLRLSADRASSDLPALLAEAEKAADNVMSGEHFLRKPGHGEEFWQFRDYHAGDSPKDIDWRQSARSDRVFIRQKEKQTPQPVCLWCAGGPSMNYVFKKGSNTKSVEASILVLALSILLTRKGEHVSLMGGMRKPGRSEYTLSRMEQQLVINMRKGKSLPEPASNDASHGYTAVLAGDFLRPIEEIENSFRNIAAAAGSATVIQILDPAEICLPFNGRVIFTDPATGEKVLIDNVEDVRSKYSARIRKHEEAIRQLCRELHWSCYSHTTDNYISETLSEIWAMMSPGLHVGERRVGL